MREWQAIDIITMLTGTALFAYTTLSGKKVSGLEKIWLLYVIGFVGLRGAVTLLCIYASSEWVNWIVPYYTLFLCASLGVLIIHSIFYENK
ncbi:MAG: hypothetical protein WC810_26665 [Janthinobacterium sp.]|jgi:hypothetical protein